VSTEIIAGSTRAVNVHSVHFCLKTNTSHTDVFRRLVMVSGTSDLRLELGISGSESDNLVIQMKIHTFKETCYYL